MTNVKRQGGPGLWCIPLIPAIGRRRLPTMSDSYRPATPVSKTKNQKKQPKKKRRRRKTWEGTPRMGRGGRDRRQMDLEGWARP